jgi:hypothetical protein
LGKLFFPHHAPWQQRRKTIIMLWSIAVGLLFGAILTGLMVLDRAHHY